MSLDFLERIGNYKFKQYRNEDCNVFFYDANEVLFIFCSFKIYYFSEPIQNHNIQLYFHSFCPCRLYIILSMNSAPK